LKRIAERAGVSFPGEIYPAAYIEEAGESREFDRLSLELETILKHLVAKMPEAGGKLKNKVWKNRRL